MSSPDLPPTAAWQHLDARSGFEVATVHRHRSGAVADPTGGGDAVVLTVSGTTTAVEDGTAWIESYRIDLDARWRTREVHVDGRSSTGERRTHLVADGLGRWRVDGRPADHLTGCLDVDLESSALTNTLPVHRLALKTGGSADTPAAYVRAADLRVERLEQRYTRLPAAGHQRYAYEAPSFGVTCELTYDGDLLVHDYPGIARRVPTSATSCGVPAATSPGSHRE